MASCGENKDNIGLAKFYFAKCSNRDVIRIFIFIGLAGCARKFNLL